MTHSLSIFDIFQRLDRDIDFLYIKKFSYIEKLYWTKFGRPKNERIVLFLLIDLIIQSNDMWYIKSHFEIACNQFLKKKSIIFSFIYNYWIKKIISFGLHCKCAYKDYPLNIFWRYGHVRNDKKEFSKNPIRPLEKITQQGISCTLENKLPKREKILFDNYDLRLVNINGFKNSKLSLLIHDYFDHVFFSHFCESHGIFERHKKFIQELGHCLNYDIFSRESEMISSLGYELREFLCHWNGLGYKDNKKSLIKMLKSIDISRIEIFKVEAIFKVGINLHTIIVRILIELQEQTKKVGRIKLNTKEWIRNLKYIEKKYLLFIIDCVYTVTKNFSQFNSSIETTYSLIENNLKDSMVQDYNSFVLSFSGISKTLTNTSLSSIISY